MMQAPSPDDLGSTAQQAFLWACMLDVMVSKPGNVSLQSAGHGMTAALFIASAKASGPAIAAPGETVGSRIERAVRLTRAVAHCNTNLGILLLCAPLAAALERPALATAGLPGIGALRQAVEQVLADLTVADAEAAYRAIAHASPGGLGDAPEQDVAAVPTVDLRTAMRMAAMRDTIARQYAHGFADLFDLGLPAFHAAMQRHASPARSLHTAVLETYLAWLGRFPDSHIVRKHGLDVAQSVTEQARDLKKRCNDGNGPDLHLLAEWDRSLKARGINPGTSADLTVATAMIAALVSPALCAIQPVP
ncbi:triphosphoribosyl-dephospho-CoA synthase [Imbroritus primus]|uniref:triphosphoribosyl-dephospho-CoA synthase n=1 Tax=Imbroritus primus TaxID=3058603 RepID=UPI003D16133B